MRSVLGRKACLAEAPISCEVPIANKGKSLKLQQGTRKPTVSVEEKRNLYPL